MSNLELYNKAKEAYYNGNPIMTDYEFDELERSLGLENKSYIGARHNPSYTVPHPFIMGSLSKVQVKQKDDGSIPWQTHFDGVMSYIRKAATTQVIITPKYDGCSFEAVVQNGDITYISTRGDGYCGKDIYEHIINKFDATHKALLYDYYVMRGEVLIDKNVFADKYSDFVNPRSFVSGLLNRDYDANNPELLAMLDDLSIVIYDVRAYDFYKGTWDEIDWTRLEMHNLPEHYLECDLTLDEFPKIYNEFAKYRETCQFALDGIVIKPAVQYRIYNVSDARPKDCVAVKFVPMLEETEVTNIEWNVGKTGELCPVIIVNPVVMDGKQITRASAHNYGYLIDNEISIGTKVILSLAGDIIPFIYKVTDTAAYDANKLNLPDYETYTEGCHLYKRLSANEWRELRFLQSAQSLNIPNIGPAAAKTIYYYMCEQAVPDEFLGISAKEIPYNILECSSADISNALGGKLGDNAMKAFDKFKRTLTLADIIVSCNFDNCGRKIAEAIQDYLLFGNENFEHLAQKGYEWCKTEDSPEMLDLYHVINKCGKTTEEFKRDLKTVNESKSEQIPVILTGEPNNYSTKGEFLKAHPEYRLTTSWKEVQIVFTNSLDSNTGKMKKAREKGIEIRIY